MFTSDPDNFKNYLHVIHHGTESCGLDRGLFEGWTSGLVSPNKLKICSTNVPDRMVVTFKVTWGDQLICEY